MRSAFVSLSLGGLFCFLPSLFWVRVFLSSVFCFFTIALCCPLSIVHLMRTAQLVKNVFLFVADVDEFYFLPPAVPASTLASLVQEPLRKWSAKMPWNKNQPELTTLNKQKNIVAAIPERMRENPSLIRDLQKEAIAEKANCVSYDKYLLFPLPRARCSC